MSWGFVVGSIYNRRRDIHERFGGGQQRGGIISIPRSGLVIVVTGHEGLQHGYHDEWLADGSLDYFGMGQVGNMTLTSGNKAIEQHSANGRSLLAFSSLRAGLRFEGEFIYASHRVVRTLDRKQQERDALVFRLTPLRSIEVAIESIGVGEAPSDFAQHRLAAYDASSRIPERRKRVGSVIVRSRIVASYVLRRANGICEGCGQPAPFLRVNGEPYLEPHHIHRLSDGGPDDPRTVIALCPTCHRRVHSAMDGRAYNSLLLERMPHIETEPGRR